MYYNKIIAQRRPVDLKTIDAARYAFYSAWHHSVIRELVTFFDFKDDYRLLADMLIPKITAKQAQESIALLERLGFIERDEHGLFHQTDTLIGVKPSAADAFVVENFQMEMLQVALKAYDAIPRPQRMSASTTFCISKDTYDLFVKKSREFRKELLELARLDNDPQRVFQYTFNLFPITRDRNENQA
jgi:uncharacterized protein (TIGR02147 family)